MSERCRYTSVGDNDDDATVKSLKKTTLRCLAENPLSRIF